MLKEEKEEMEKIEKIKAEQPTEKSEEIAMEKSSPAKQVESK